MEDNNLWLRHLLNLVVQVALSIYVFWKSIDKQSSELLISGISLFIAGIIKYGERIWSLKSGSFESLKSSDGNHYKQRLPEAIHANGSYTEAAWTSLQSMIDVFHIFSARPGERYMRHQGAMQHKKLLKVLEIQLGMMYDDLYTKSHVLRTKSGIILRDSYTRDFSSTIVVVHFLTEIALSECSELDGNVEEDIKHLVELCQALSRYMMYLLVNHPSLLPVSANTLATLERSRTILQEMELRRVPSVDVRKLEEIRDVWIGIIIYVAAKSRPEMHAAQLARGGELLTFVWLLLAEYKLGDLGGVRLELTNILF
ncbi:hypothetical protein HU200_038154 [Digitaria exilis]|uniref:DUF4220 domain-containing protein n=1 Tax=Digitaria exilis TaxID=1010633 RepID=A0A835EM60_9POAL|nr:hypothetical protein HU200_038154 [Digitaria exilis]